MSDIDTAADVPPTEPAPETEPEPTEEPAGVPEPVAASKRRLPFETLAVAGAAWAWAAVLLRIWDMPMRLPLDTRSDATLISAMVKTISERGWYLNQPRLGAPFGQQFYDFPHGGETFQLFAMKILVMITGDWGLAINLYFFLGFGVLAAVTFLVLRHLRFGPVVSGIGALVFTFMPYHFTHGEMHLWRSTYYSAPLACLLLVWATAWRERFLKDPSLVGWKVHRGNVRWARVAGAVAIAVLIAGTETMTTGFTMVLLGSGALVAAIRFREPSRLLGALALIGVMGITFVTLSYPTLNFYKSYGTNEKAARRLVTESELYGLKLSRMLTPQGGHRSHTLSEIGNRAQDKSAVRSEGGQALGFLGIAGFLGALWGAFSGRWRREKPDIRPGWDRSALTEDATTFTLLALLFGTIGGLAILVSMAGFSQIRVWNRIILIIAFFAMTVVLRWSEHFTAWVRRRSAHPKPVLAVVALLVLAFGLWDSVPPIRMSYAKIEAQHASDREFVAQIEGVMPDGAKILQLPIIEFPEAEPVGKMVDYDHLRGYLADDGTLQWSYGSIKGRPDAAWQVTLRDKVGPIGALTAIMGLGFDGIWIDTYGYVGKEDEVQKIIDSVGVEPMVSPDGRFIFLNLEDFKRRTNMSDEELRQAAIDILGVTPPEGTP